MWCLYLDVKSLTELQVHAGLCRQSLEPREAMTSQNFMNSVGLFR